MSWKTFTNNLEQNSPAILTGLGVLGVFSTVYLAYKNTQRAILMIGDAEYKKGDYLDKREAFDLTWKCYIPTAISAVSTAGCIVGAYYCSAKQTEAISSAYLMSQATLHEYQRKVIDQIGERKEKEIRNEVIKEIADNRSPVALYSQREDVIDTGHGNTLFYDVPGDRYFKSEINFVKSVVNDLNHDVRTEMFFDWNELYYRWGLPMRKYGSEMIFDVDRPLEVKLEPELMENGQVRILVDYELYPRCV